MKLEDPDIIHQKELPVQFYRETLSQAKLSNDPLPLAIAYLLIMAFFWCMHFCGCSDVKGECRTTKLCLCHFCFFDGNRRQIPLRSPKIFDAACLAITFEQQKKEVQDDTITQHQSHDPGICSVCSTATIISCICSYHIVDKNLPNTSNNTFLIDGQLFTIPSQLVLYTIRRIVKYIGTDALGFGPDDVNPFKLHIWSHVLIWYPYL